MTTNDEATRDAANISIILNPYNAKAKSSRRRRRREGSRSRPTALARPPLSSAEGPFRGPILALFWGPKRGALGVKSRGLNTGPSDSSTGPHTGPAPKVLFKKHRTVLISICNCYTFSNPLLEAGFQPGAQYTLRCPTSPVPTPDPSAKRRRVPYPGDSPSYRPCVLLCNPPS